MVLKRMLATVGIGGATVETALDKETVRPGRKVSGTLKVTGGKVAQTIEAISVGLRATVEKEYEYENSQGEERSGEYKVDVVVAEQVVRDKPMELQPGQEFELPFELRIPMEAPITALKNKHILGGVGVSTRLHVDNALDSTDVDPLLIKPLPAQRAVLRALRSLGFKRKDVDLEKGKIPRTRQKLPFYQEFEYSSPGKYKGLNSLELTFFTDKQGVDVVLELDKKRGVLFSEGGDKLLRLSIDHDDTDDEKIAAKLHKWINNAAGKRSTL
ncbi:sporulation-control protein [Lipingzhangella halophila]|uniref:Sporulation-control protein n=1 Tax=Lipingzhangella halophila TaxID=1783352 RepID=A0A7W7RMB5_9ACTN|nr:sporulation protein [Lipingzhangella halophila]MBB4934614.1 sporulation-control protein [Lipingzhangella halophila]